MSSKCDLLLTRWSFRNFNISLREFTYFHFPRSHWRIYWGCQFAEKLENLPFFSTTHDVYRRISAGYAGQILSELLPYLDNITIWIAWKVLSTSIFGQKAWINGYEMKLNVCLWRLSGGVFNKLCALTLLPEEELEFENAVFKRVIPRVCYRKDAQVSS